MIELKYIMLIDDDSDILKIAQLALCEIGGFELVICESGKAALESLKTFQPQLILLDVMMPEMDGPTTFKKIRQLQVETPIVFMTAKVQKNEIDDYWEMGAIGIIPKPFDPISLCKEIVKIWSGIQK